MLRWTLTVDALLDGWTNEQTMTKPDAVQLLLAVFWSRKQSQGTRELFTAGRHLVDQFGITMRDFAELDQDNRSRATEILAYLISDKWKSMGSGVGSVEWDLLK